MKMRFHRGMACFGGALVGLAGPAIAAEPADADGTSLTIYANNQALVQDASLSATDMQVIEQNFDYDLLSPAKIMENAVGETVTLGGVDKLPI